MEIVYYYDKELGYCPVKRYLAEYIISEKDKEKQKNKKNKILAKIDDNIKQVSEHNGISPSPKIAKSLKGYGLSELLSKKDSNILIRIIYFCCRNKMVLLYAFEKLSDYDTDKIIKKIKKHCDVADQYRQAFILDQKYEKYN